MKAEIVSADRFFDMETQKYAARIQVQVTDLGDWDSPEACKAATKLIRDLESACNLFSCEAA